MHSDTPGIDRSSHAIVVGGGVAGLLAARVLTNHFRTVTLVERDRLPHGPGWRSGAPQATHNHVLLLRGLLIVERLFPNVRNELAALGAPVLDMAADVAWLTAAGWGVRFPSELKILSCTRDLLEWTLRQRLATNDAVRFLDGTDVTGLVHEEGRVVGVRTRQRLGSSGDRAERAQLVVDASGRHSKLPEWIADIGYRRPKELVVNGYLGYASRFYRIPDAARLGWRGLYVQPAPPTHKRGGVVAAVERDRWHVTLAGVGGDYPPTDETGFLTFAQSLRSRVLYDAIRHAEPLSPITGFRATENRWRSYERLHQWPDGLAVLGDGACAFNPVYAQGMTIAAMAAETLDLTLAGQPVRKGGIDLDGFGSRFQRALARGNSAPWQMATSEDLRVPQTTGGRPTLATKLTHAYFDRLTRLTTERQDVRLAFLRCMHMLDGPGALFTPRIVRAALGARRLPDSVDHGGTAPIATHP